MTVAFTSVTIIILFGKGIDHLFYSLLLRVLRSSVNKLAILVLSVHPMFSVGQP